MNRTTSTTRDFAGRLMACEAKEKNSSHPKGPSTFKEFEKLRPYLSSLMGKDGFRALSTRALVLAGREAPALRLGWVGEDGSLQGWDEVESRSGREEFLEARRILLAQLLGLMVAFVGQTLTIRLVCEVWPKVSLGDLDFGKGDKNEKGK